MGLVDSCDPVVKRDPRPVTGIDQMVSHYECAGVALPLRIQSAGVVLSKFTCNVVSLNLLIGIYIMSLASKWLGGIALSSVMFAQVATVNAGDAVKDIVDTAVSAGTFDTLVTAVQAAELVDTLKGEGPFTVFAPSDDAFAKFAESDLNALLADKDGLTDVLNYHVIPGKVMAKDVLELTNATTVQGQDVAIEVKDGKVYVDGAQVTATDIEASNGIIHVIDTVIMPK